MTTDLVQSTELGDGVLGVTLNRPPVNAVNWELMEALRDAFIGLNFTRNTVALIRSNPGQPFCAGADLKERIDSIRFHQRALLWRAVLTAMRQSPIPIIAAVDGACLGGGVALITHCDFVLASERAFFGMPEIRVGRAGGGSHLRRFVSEQAVRRLMLTGERIPADEALRIHLVQEVVPEGDWGGRPLFVARSIASFGDRAVRLVKRSLDDSEYLGVEEGYTIEQKYTRQLREEDLAEYRS